MPTLTQPYGTTSSATHEPLRFKREMTRHPGSFNPKLAPAKQYKFDGQGGFKPNSGRIPVIDAALFVGGTALVIAATLRIAFWIWG